MVIVSDILLPKNADGILKVSDVSTSEGGDLSARTDPADPASSQFIKANTNNNLAVYLANGEGGGSLNATEYPVVQVGGFDGDNFSSLQVGRTGRLETYNIDKNGSAQALLGSAGATAILGDSTIVPIADPEGRDGWNFVNSVASTKFNLYYFNGNQEIITLEKINSVFAKVYINNFATLSGAPFFHIYTKPTGVGDAGAFYHSRIDYVIDSSVIVGIGEQVILYGENKPNTPCNNRLIQLKNKIVNGDGAGTEEILYITLSSDSGASINDKNITVSSMGFNTTDMGGTNGIINREFKLISGDSGGATETTLSALNNKISQGEGDITGGGNGLQQILCYGKDQSGNLDPLNVDNNGHLKITLNDIEAGIVNPINVASKHQNAYLQILSGGSTTIGGTPILTTAHTLSAGAGGSGKNPITLYVYFGAGTSDSNFSVEVHKSYDGVIYFNDTNFIFTPVGSDTGGNPQPAVVANGFSDGQFLKVEITNNNEVNTTSIDVFIIERQ